MARSQLQVRCQEKILYCECGEALEQVSQTSYGYLIPQNLQGPEEPALEKGISGHSRVWVSSNPSQSVIL